MKDVNEDTKKALALAKRDQLIECFKDHKEQLITIDEEGPKSSEDVKLVQMCLRFTLGEVCMAEADNKDNPFNA